jgi:hypothetical protein
VSLALQLDTRRARSFDPTGTTKIRRVFRADAQMRLRRLRGQMRIAIVEHDVLALGGTEATPIMAYHPEATRLAAFHGWMASATAQALAGPWFQQYVDLAVRHGVETARKEMCTSIMSAALRTRRPVPVGEAPPPEISFSLVDSLYKDGRTFLVGTILVTGPAFIIYWKTGEIPLLICALAIVLVACARAVLMHVYFRMRSTVTSLEIATRWERRYLAGATVSHALLGIWCFVAFSQSSDPFVYLFSFSVTIIYAAGIFGRNFANPRFVFVQIFCVWAPMTAALLLYGSPYHWIFAGFPALSFLGIKFMADRLRRTLFDAVTTSRDMALLASRFDAARTAADGAAGV